jgi:hypothetical protein
VQIYAEKKWIRVSGVDYHVGPATLATVAIALELFEIQIEECIRDPARAIDSLGAIIQTCDPKDLERAVEGTVALPPGKRYPSDMVTLALAILDMTDLVSIARSLGPDPLSTNGGDVDAVTDPEEELSTADVSVITVAARFGCPPHEVYTWPYTSFIAAAKCLPLLRLHEDRIVDSEPRVTPKRGIPFDLVFGNIGTMARPKVDA